MAIDRPGAIEAHPRRKPQGRSAAEDGRPEIFLSSARNAVGRGPRSCAGWPGRGRKSLGRRCGQVIEAEPALGQIRPSEVRVARPERAHGETGGNRLRDARGRTQSAQKDLRWRINGDAAGSPERSRPRFAFARKPVASPRGKSMRIHRRAHCRSDIIRAEGRRASRVRRRRWGAAS